VMTMRRRKRKDENGEIIVLLRAILVRLDELEKEVKRTCGREVPGGSPTEIIDKADVKASIT